MQSFVLAEEMRSLLLHIETSGHQAYLVGGCVRDGMMGIPPQDWDVCTDALPNEIHALFPDSLTYGMRHGTVTVRWENLLVQVTTFRAEGAYSDHRRPDSVRFITELRDDLARRDFTVNAMALDRRGVLHDPFGGQNDLKAGVLRAVGDAKNRFSEDALRMFRAVRLSAQLGFSIEEETWNALLSCASLAATLAAERVCAELERALMTSRPEAVSCMAASGLLAPWGIVGALPETEKLCAIPQERTLRWMGFALLQGGLETMQQLRLDRRTLSAGARCAVLRSAKNRDDLFWKGEIFRSGKTVSRACAQVLSVWEQSDDLLAVDSILSSGDCCTLAELAIGGADAAAMGLRGKEISSALEAALRHVWSHPEDNTKDALTQYIADEKGAGTPWRIPGRI